MGRFGTWVSRVQDFIYAQRRPDAIPGAAGKYCHCQRQYFLGLGPGKSRQRNFLPQAYNDFIYSIIIEEYGLLGGAFIIFIYMVFLFRCIHIFRQMSVCFWCLPGTGLKFQHGDTGYGQYGGECKPYSCYRCYLAAVSMGGSSFLFTCAAIGIILSVARNVEQLEGKNTEPPAGRNG